jgi:hypothetical protein
VETEAPATASPGVALLTRHNWAPISAQRIEWAAFPTP